MVENSQREGGEMKRNLISVLVILLILSVSCSKKESSITIKAGVVMKSGDVKDVARQEFLITKTDLIEAWKGIKEEVVGDMDLVREDIIAENDYTAQINSLENEIANLRKAIKELPTLNSEQFKKAKTEYIKILNEYEEIDPENSTDDYSYPRHMEKVIENLEDMEDSKISVDRVLERFTGRYWPIPDEQKEKYKKIQEKLKNNVSDLIDAIYWAMHESEAKLAKKTQEQEALSKEINKKVDEKYELQMKNAQDEFNNQLKDKIISSFKTNLEGQSAFTLRKGQYYIFGLAKIADNNIIWSLPFDVEKSEQDVELSNDNAHSISDDVLFIELSEALMKLQINGKD